MAADHWPKNPYYGEVYRTPQGELMVFTREGWQENAHVCNCGSGHLVAQCSANDQYCG